MSDHDHRGEYADDRHDHDNDYAGKHHRHYDLERDVESLRALLEQWRADLRELREDLRDALERIRQLEDRQPDYAGPEADDDEPGARDEELSPVLCLRVIMTSNGPRQCRLPVDHEPDAACPGNPHARPAPEAGQP